jgi:hypothetical protein
MTATRRRSGGRPASRPGERLTGRGGVLVVFAGCFLGLLVAEWANWGELAGAVFFMASSLTAYYVRPSGLLPVVVSPPLLFFAACALEKALISAGLLAAFSGTMVTLADSAGWLFAGTGLTILIALLRGLRSEVRALVLALRALSRCPQLARELEHHPLLDRLDLCHVLESERGELAEHAGDQVLGNRGAARHAHRGGPV